MKYPAALNLVLPIALALPAIAQDPEPAPIAPTVHEVNGMVDEAIWTMRYLVESGRVRASDVERFRELVAQWAQAAESDFPDAQEVRKRLERYTTYLTNKVSSTFLRLQHVAELKEEFVEARLDRALSILESRARAGNWTSEQYFAVVRLFHERAEAAVDFPDSESARARLEAMLDKALARATAIGADLAEARYQLAKERLARRIALARSHANAGEDTTEDRIRIAELLIEREQLAKEVELVK